MEHKPFCDGTCDEGRRCWQGGPMDPAEAARRGIKLLSVEEVEALIRENEQEDTK